MRQRFLDARVRLRAAREAEVRAPAALPARDVRRSRQRRAVLALGLGSLPLLEQRVPEPGPRPGVLQRVGAPGGERGAERGLGRARLAELEVRRAGEPPGLGEKRVGARGQSPRPLERGERRQRLARGAGVELDQAARQDPVLPLEGEIGALDQGARALQRVLGVGLPAQLGVRPGQPRRGPCFAACVARRARGAASPGEARQRLLVVSGAARELAEEHRGLDRLRGPPARLEVRQGRGQELVGGLEASEVREHRSPPAGELDRTLLRADPARELRRALEPALGLGEPAFLALHLGQRLEIRDLLAPEAERPLELRDAQERVAQAVPVPQALGRQPAGAHLEIGQLERARTLRRERCVPAGSIALSPRERRHGREEGAVELALPCPLIRVEGRQPRDRGAQVAFDGRETLRLQDSGQAPRGGKWARVCAAGTQGFPEQLVPEQSRAVGLLADERAEQHVVLDSHRRQRLLCEARLLVLWRERARRTEGDAGSEGRPCDLHRGSASSSASWARALGS